MLMRFLYDKRQNRRILEHEDAMLRACQKIACRYAPLFQRAGCTLAVFPWWTDSRTTKCAACRLPFQRGYLCYVACAVRRNGEVVRVKSDDGEADYYILEASWPVAALERRFFWTYAYLYDTMDQVREELDLLLELLERDDT